MTGQQSTNPSTANSIVEKRQFSIGKYIGNGEQLTALVVLNPDEVLQVPVANE